MLPAFAAIALGTPTLIGLAVWAVVRSGDRDTPTPSYATGGVIDPAIGPEDVADFYRRIDELPTQPSEWVKGALHGVTISGSVLDEQKFLTAIKAAMRKEQGQ